MKIVLEEKLEQYMREKNWAHIAIFPVMRSC